MANEIRSPREGRRKASSIDTTADSTTSSQPQAKRRRSASKNISESEAGIREDKWKKVVQEHISLLEVHARLLREFVQEAGENATELREMRDRAEGMLMDARKVAVYVKENHTTEGTTARKSSLEADGKGTKDERESQEDNESSRPFIPTRKRSKSSIEDNATHSSSPDPSICTVRKKPRRHVPESTTTPPPQLLATSIDFASLHDSLVNEVANGLRLQAERQAEEQAVNATPGTDRKKRKRISVGGEGVVVEKKSRRKSREYGEINGNEKENKAKRKADADHTDGQRQSRIEDRVIARTKKIKRI